MTVTVIIMKGVGAWNDFLYPMYIMQKPKMYTVVLVIKQYFSEASTDLARRCSLLRAGDASDHRALYLPQQILYQGALWTAAVK